MTTTDNFDDLLASGAPAFKFEQPGDTAKGIVVDATNQQKTTYLTGEREFWPNGDPKMELVVTLRTEDNSEVRVFCKPSAKSAIQEAVRKSGASFMPGGRLAVQYTSDEPAEKAGMNPKKLFTAQYEGPAPKTTVSDDLFSS